MGSRDGNEDAGGTAGPALRCLGGRPGAPQLGAELLLAVDLPPEAREGLWAILSQCLLEVLPPNLDEQVTLYERAHGLPPTVLPRLLRVSRALVVAAALRGLSREDFEADLRDLTGTEDAGRMLGAGYDEAAELVRSEGMRSALRPHGPVLDGIEWRVDHTQGSHRGDGLRFGFAVMTLRYEERGKTEHVTLQLTPDMLLKLEGACHAMLGRPEPEGG